MTFADRFEAGSQLAKKLAGYKGKDCVVLAIPRGGVETGLAVARNLGAPLDIVLTKKIGSPENEEYAIGAVSLTGVVLNKGLELPESYVGSETRRIRELLKKRYELYRGKKKPLQLRGKIVIIVDDGIATGQTMLAAIEAVRLEMPGKIVVAVPVGPPEVVGSLRSKADEVVCLEKPEEFFSIGQFYESFEQVDDNDVVSMLQKAVPVSLKSFGSDPKEIDIQIKDVVLKGILTIPHNAIGIVLFAHGSGSDRFSPRNRNVATVLQNSGIATLLFDLLTEEEEAFDIESGSLRFDIDFLAGRLSAATDWVKKRPDTKGVRTGYFGASTGAAAALVAAAKRSDIVAIVSRGGRPDLAKEFLPKVEAPVLLIVGGDDTPVIEMNKKALERLSSVKELKIVQGATHLFEEPGTLEEVAGLAAGWFKRHLTTSATHRGQR